MLQVLADGLIIGSVVSLGAIGLSLCFSILRFANFGHGELLAWGAYVALSALAVFSAVAGRSFADRAVLLRLAAAGRAGGGGAGGVGPGAAAGRGAVPPPAQARAPSRW